MPLSFKQLFVPQAKISCWLWRLTFALFKSCNRTVGFSPQNVEIIDDH